MRYIRSRVEQTMDPMTTITPNDRESIGLSMFLNNVSNFSILLTWFDNIYSFTQALVGYFDQLFVLVANISNKKGFVQISMESVVVYSYVNIT